MHRVYRKNCNFVWSGCHLLEMYSGSEVWGKGVLGPRLGLSLEVENGDSAVSLTFALQEVLRT